MTDGFPGKGIASKRPRRDLSVLDVQAELRRKMKKASKKLRFLPFLFFFFCSKEDNRIIKSQAMNGSYFIKLSE